MHSFSLAKNLRGYISAYGLDALTELTTATHSTKNTDYLDRLAGGTPQSACLFAVIDGDIATTGETITLKVNLADAASTTGSGLADLGTTTWSVVIGSTASTAALTGQVGTLFKGVDLTTAKQYVRAEWSLTFSGSSTAASHQATVGIGLITGGFESLPST